MNAYGVPDQGSEAIEPYVDVEQLPGREDLERLDRGVRRFVGERPLTSVLLALTTGYVVGRVLARIR